jgi:zinc transport system substrate-binding protein
MFHLCKVGAILMGATLLSAVAPTRAHAELKVVATMKPVHGLVTMVMGATGAPKLIVEGAASAHTYALKPSDAAAVGNADVVFRMSERIEGFTVKLAKTLRKSTEMVTLVDTPRLTLLPVRLGATFEKHGEANPAHTLIKTMTTTTMELKRLVCWRWMAMLGSTQTTLVS